MLLLRLMKTFLIVVLDDQIHLAQVLGDKSIVLAVRLVVLLVTLVQVFLNTLVLPPLRNPLPAQSRLNMNEPLVVHEFLDLFLRLSIGQQVDSLEDENLCLYVHDFAMRVRIHSLLIEIRSSNLFLHLSLMPAPPDEVYHRLAVKRPLSTTSSMCLFRIVYLIQVGLWKHETFNRYNTAAKFVDFANAFADVFGDGRFAATRATSNSNHVAMFVLRSFFDRRVAASLLFRKIGLVVYYTLGEFCAYLLHLHCVGCGIGVVNCWC